MDKIRITDIPKVQKISSDATLYAKSNNEFVQVPVNNILKKDELPIVKLDILGESEPNSESYVDGIIKYKSATLSFETPCKCKYQGNSTLNAPLKNYKIKLETAIEFEGWGARTEFVLKADWADPNRNRNVCCAKLWGQICEAYPDEEPDFLKKAINHGAIDGFPILFTDPLKGCVEVYNWTIPKFQSFELPDGAVAAEFTQNSNGDTNGVNGSGPLSGDNEVIRTIVGAGQLSHWYAYEGIKDRHIEETKNYLINGWKFSTDDDSLKHVFVDKWCSIPITDTMRSDSNRIQSFDPFCVPQLVRYYIFTWFIRNLDGWNKNMIMIYYDGKFYPVPYDMDLTMGINMVDINDISQGIYMTFGIDKQYNNNYYEPNSDLWLSLSSNYKSMVDDVYANLGNVLSPENILKLFYFDYEQKYSNVPGVHLSCNEVSPENARKYIYDFSAIELPNSFYSHYNYTVGGVTGS